MNIASIGKGVIDGVVSIPVDFYYGIERTLEDLSLSDGGQMYQSRNFDDDSRLYQGLKRICANRTVIIQITEIIINDALSHLPDSAVQKIHDAIARKATAVGSRQITQLAIGGIIGARLVDGIAAAAISRLAIRIGTSFSIGVVLTQGLISRAAQASRRLLHENPGLYQKLWVQNFDMLYFLFEKPLENFLSISKLARSNPAQLESVINEINNM